MNSDMRSTLLGIFMSFYKQPVVDLGCRQLKKFLDFLPSPDDNIIQCCINLSNLSHLLIHM